MSTLTSPVSCLDWRAGDAADVVPLVDAEIRAWRDTLWWDIAESWHVVEPARQAGQLPGLLAVGDTGRPVGWAAFLPHNGALQVMAIAADDEHATAALVDGVLDSAEARACDSTVLCVRDTGPVLRRALDDRGFIVDPYRYLVRDLDGHGSGEDVRHARMSGSFQRWRNHDAAMAALCERAYCHEPGVRAFAPGGTPAEWRQYIATLVQGTGCGWFLPELSVVAPSEATNAGPRAVVLDAAVMVTDLGTGVAHIAQLAVDPLVRGRGLAGRLVDTALAEAARLYERMSLLVSSSNVAALHLYESRGFRHHASFVVASRRRS